MELGGRAIRLGAAARQVRVWVRVKVRVRVRVSGRIKITIGVSELQLGRQCGAAAQCAWLG